jgi:hypothetical protein
MACDQTAIEEVETSFKLGSLAEGVEQTRLDLVFENN